MIFYRNTIPQTGLILYCFLYTGNHDHRTAKKLITSIDQAVREKLQFVLNKSPFMSVLSDGSQARKTGDDKEIVLTRIERNGTFLLCLFLVSISFIKVSNGKKKMINCFWSFYYIALISIQIVFITYCGGGNFYFF